jgi:aspartate kinase
MHNNDPRVVKNTRPIATLSFTEAAELAYFGAKILHPACILPAQSEKVPVKLLNTMQPDAEGTTILEPTDDMAIGPKAVAAKDGVISISVQSSRSMVSYRFLPKVFEVFEKHKVAIDLITTTEISVNVTIEQVVDLPLEAIISDLAQLGAVEVQQDQTIISVVGNKIAQTPDVLLKVFESVKNIPIKMVSYGGSQHSISFLIAAEHKTETLQKLNVGLFAL